MKSIFLYIAFLLFGLMGTLKAQDSTVAAKLSFWAELSHSFNSRGNARQGIENHSWGESSAQSGSIYEPKQNIVSLPRTTLSVGLNSLINKSKNSKTDILWGAGFQYSVYRPGIAFFNENNMTQKRNLIFNLQQIAVPIQLEFRFKNIPLQPNVTAGICVTKKLAPSFSLSGDALENSFYISTVASSSYKKIFLYPYVNVGLNLLERNKHSIRLNYKYEHMALFNQDASYNITRKRTDLITKSTFTPFPRFNSLCISYLFRLK